MRMMSIAFYYGTIETGGRIWLQAGAVGLRRMAFPKFRDGGIIANIVLAHLLFEYLPDGFGLNEVVLTRLL